MIQVHAISDGKLSAIPSQRLPKEDDLQRWIAEDPLLIGLDLLIIGREIYTSFGAQVDLLGLDQDGNLVIIECKRERTPREVIAQLLDYGNWVSGLSTRQVYEGLGTEERYFQTTKPPTHAPESACQLTAPDPIAPSYDRDALAENSDERESCTEWHRIDGSIENFTL